MSSTVSQRIKAFNADRLPHIVQRKYKAMSKDAFRFYRGTCHLFYEDLAKESAFPPSPAAWLCGDLHPENFGSYKGDNRQVYFDISDFDEAVLGPALWDLARMTSGIFVLYNELGLPNNEAQNAAAGYLKGYAETLAGGKARHIEENTATGVVKKLLDNVKERKKEEWLKSRIEEDKHGRLVFVSNEGKQLPMANDAEKQNLLNHLAAQNLRDKNDEPFRVWDVCFRLAGTGSLGIRRYLFLLQSPEGKKRLVDMKEIKASSLAPFVQTAQPNWPSEAERVVSLTGRMQDVPRALLAATSFEGVPYKLQEMQPSEDKVDTEEIKDDPLVATEFFTDAATLTASAQLRGAGRDGSAIADELIAFGRNGNWQEDLLRYASEYAAQAVQDYNHYKADFENGFFA